MQNNIIYAALGGFIGGAVISGLIVWKVVDKKCEEKYEALYQEEKKSLKEHFTVPKPELKSKSEELNGDSPVKKLVNKAADTPLNKPSLTEYVKKVKEYKNYSNVEVPVDDKSKARPYVIAPEEYGDEPEYDCEELTYYADGVLANSDDEVLDPDEYLGKGSLDHIGDYERDSLHVRNDAKKTYYEVLVDERDYERATGKTKPDPDKDYELYRRMDKKDDDEQRE